MRFQHGDINIYYYHDTLTPENVRAASYGSSHDSGTLVPEVGDVLNGFPGWTGSEYEPITVRVVSVVQIGKVNAAYDVRVTTVSAATSECGAYYGHKGPGGEGVHPAVCRRPAGIRQCRPTEPDTTRPRSRPTAP